jgi:hypothetical protein
MDWRISFGAKEETNAQREREFLALTPAERLLWFLKSFEGRVNNDPSVVQNKGNFIVSRRKDALR